MSVAATASPRADLGGTAGDWARGALVTVTVCSPRAVRWPPLRRRAESQSDGRFLGTEPPIA